MKYQLIKVDLVGSPQNNKDGLTWDIFINVTTGIVGDIYKFTRANTTSFNCAKTLTGDQIVSKANDTGVAYILKNYPNT